MQTRRNILAAAAIAPFALALPALAAPTWDVETWVRQWAAMGGSVMLVGGKLSFAFRPEDHEIANPLFREFKQQPNGERAVTQFMLDRGLDGYSFGMPAPA
jgi:hypothetical protein